MSETDKLPDLNEFVKKLPFKVTPTNIPGVYDGPAIPKDLDLRTASTRELASHGILLRKPDANLSPGLHQAWEQVMSGNVREQILAPLTVHHGMTHNLRSRPRKTSNGTFLGPVWSGAVLDSGEWTCVIGVWNIPTVTKPTEAQGSEAGGGWKSSSWIGIDGYGLNDVLQCGITQNVNSSGNASYYPWFEWYVTPPPWGKKDSNGNLQYPDQWLQQYGYIYETYAGFSVSPGDKTQATVSYYNSISGQVYLWNETTGKSATKVLAPPPTAAFAGKSAEWIMEAPDGGEPTTSLPKFSPVVFSSASAGTPDGKLGNPNAADLLNIETAGGKSVTQASSGNQTVEIKFIG